QSKKFYPFLKAAISATDGSHIPVHPPAKIRARFRNRKGDTSTNVLASCSFDMLYCHILAGWEGSISDGALLADARAHDFKPPQGRFFLGDAGFPLCNDMLVPYRGVRYHLREWESAKKRPATPKELFNLRHSQCRNV
ncbi:hypothetical protein M422DRAFT_137877, partial [Sphaerobolus stellatus SS14]